ncbi:FAD-dependent monooxygenase [Amycolatopsis saalfeldensis]|uniref:2-polyprenyl-6-methoxyphenol hydroxylase n=1 Tax=Amycolatopsis saalfeldensis TaxID=394193 RepID=A0A1H8TFK2_9PSEU|nr:FAD-dependent monooxygenase [Amycolatopsis saalfeldensis]SEO89536.1 2-polyprenyl-6-methoxyphenol hydroxylase [Amycolatopsis saalfeldensis]
MSSTTENALFDTDLFDTDVLIVGAGPTGLTLACELARRGVRHRIVERLETPSRTSRGKGLQARSLEVFDDLGIAAEILTTGEVKLPVRLYDVDGGWTDREPLTTPSAIATPYPEMLWIAEFDVERVLRERHAQYGGEVRFGTAVTGLTEVESGVEAGLRGPDGPGVLRARWVVGADGGGSIVRKTLGIPFEGVTRPTSYYLGDVRTLDLDRGRMHMWASETGMLALTPLPGTDLWQFQCAVPTSAGGYEEPSLELYQRIIDDRAGAGRVRFTDVSWLSLYGANVRLAEHYREGRVLIAGDAAHNHTPAGGQGMNMGIQDAYNLGWKLAAVLRGADPALLDTYEPERRPVAEIVLAASTAKSDRVQDNAHNDATHLSTALVGLTDDFTPGLTIAYPRSALTHDGAGRRVPYVTGLRGPGFAGTTADLVRGPHWAALAFADDTDFELGALRHDEIRLHRIGKGAITDPHDALRSAFGVEDNTLVLIRPDGHIALTTPLHPAPVLPEALASFLPNGAHSG